MKAIIQVLTICFALLIIAHPYRAAMATDFTRYQVILDRKPFGEPPPDSLGSNSVPGAQSFIKDIRMVAITEDGNGGLKVGFVDIKSNKPYYLAVGDSEDGIQVVEANYKSESALLKKETDEQWVSMNADAAVVTQPGAHRGAAVSADRTSSWAHVPSAARKHGESSVLYIPAEPSKLQGEELQKQLREYNKNLIRAKGAKGTPLPMPLPEEDDAQLVAEGVLPPMAEGAAETAPAAGE